MRCGRYTITIEIGIKKFLIVTFKCNEQYFVVTNIKKRLRYMNVKCFSEMVFRLLISAKPL